MVKLKEEIKKVKRITTYIQDTWRNYGFPLQSEYLTFTEYWNWSVHNGSSAPTPMPSTSVSFTDTTSEVALPH